MTKKSKIKKRKLAAVVGTTLTILIVGIIAVGIWQRNNIKALWIALNEDTETIAEKQEQQKAKRQEILEKYEKISFVPECILRAPFTINNVCS